MINTIVEGSRLKGGRGGGGLTKASIEPVDMLYLGCAI